MAAPVALQRELARHPTPEQVGAYTRAHWETLLAWGALRDDFCDAGGRPLVGSSVSPDVSGLSDHPFGQRFPNPSPARFRARVAAVGERFGFRVVALDLLRPRGLAPLLVVSTERERKAFVRDVPEIMSLLDPQARDERGVAVTFEGFFFEARDAKGPFVHVASAHRGTSMGSQWSWDRCVYPYPHLGSISTTRTRCPD